MLICYGWCLYFIHFGQVNESEQQFRKSKVAPVIEEMKKSDDWVPNTLAERKNKQTSEISFAYFL